MQTRYAAPTLGVRVRSDVVDDTGGVSAAVVAAVAAILAIPIAIVAMICSICGARSFGQCYDAVIDWFAPGREC